MAAVPVHACPRCARTLEYHVTIEMLNPPVGKLDTGYCPTCARMFECIRETGTFFESTLWPPLCRDCRQPVALVSMGTDGDAPGTALYQCRDHAREQWTWNRVDDRWSRIAP
jgi:hypothetical protein